MSAVIGYVIKGLLTFVVPEGVINLSRRLRRVSGRVNNARYAYAVWMRHLVTAHAKGMDFVPSTVLEAGPGDSLGVGLAALLTGAGTYFALDAVDDAETAYNRSVLEDLVSMFSRREKIPGPGEFPTMRPELDSYDFPEHIFPPGHIEKALAPERLQCVREALAALGRPCGGLSMSYVQKTDAPVLRENSVDLVISHAVMEHVVDLEGLYAGFHGMLRSGGYMSHLIDLKSHGTASSWDGHWTYSDFTWKLIKGNRPYFINREPVSRHISLQEKKGFRIAYKDLMSSEPSLKRTELAPHYRDLSDQDRTTSLAYILSVKP